MSIETSAAAFGTNAALETFDLAFPGSGTVLSLAFSSLFGGGGGAPPRDYWTRWSYDPPHGVWHHDQSAANSPNAPTMDQAVSALVLSTARNVRYLSFDDPAFYFFVSIAMGDTGGGSWQVSSNWTLKTNGSFDPATGGDNSFAYQSGAIPETQVQNALTLAAYGVIRQEVMSGHIARIEALDYLFQLPAEQMDPATAKANIQAAVRQAAIYRAKVIGNNSLPALIGVDNGVPATWTNAPPPPPAPAPVVAPAPAPVQAAPPPAPTVADVLVAQAEAQGIKADPGALVSAFTQYANGPASMLGVPPVTAQVPQVTPALPLVPVVAAPPPAPPPKAALPAWVPAAALVGLFAFVGKKGRPRHV